MKKLIIPIAIVLGAVGVFALSMLGGEDNESMSDMSQRSSEQSKSDKKEDSAEMEDLTNRAEVTMDIKDFAFSRPNIKVKKGTKVTWTNQDSAKHNVILDNTASGAPAQAEVKPDVLAGPLLAKGESYSFTFNEVIDNGYHCSPHPYMKGSVAVVE